MIPLPSRSPFTGGEIIVTRFYCPESDSSVEGQFAVTNPFTQLSPAQVEFVELFVRSEGRISRMEGELGLSYPTIRSRLKEIVEALGYEAHNDGADEEAEEPGPEHHSENDDGQRIEVENIVVDDKPAGRKGKRKSKAKQKQNDAANAAATAEERQRIIQELDEGKISFDEAMSKINQGKA